MPAITSLAFAAELFYKVISFQHFGKYAKSHDLFEMFSALSPDTKHRMST